jgi:hypothetical protein
MAELGSAIHAFSWIIEGVDAPTKSGHDVQKWPANRKTGIARQ